MLHLSRRIKVFLKIQYFDGGKVLILTQSSYFILLVKTRSYAKLGSTFIQLNIDSCYHPMFKSSIVFEIRWIQKKRQLTDFTRNRTMHIAKIFLRLINFIIYYLLFHFERFILYSSECEKREIIDCVWWLNIWLFSDIVLIHFTDNPKTLNLNICGNHTYFFLELENRLSKLR